MTRDEIKNADPSAWDAMVKRIARADWHSAWSVYRWCKTPSQIERFVQTYPTDIVRKVRDCYYSRVVAETK